MRDYVRLFCTTDDTPYVGTNYIYNHYFFKTQKLCQDFIDANPVSPGGGTLSAAFPLWFRLNFETVYEWVSSMGITNIGLPDSLVKNANGVPVIYYESPRNLGVNSIEEKKTSSSAQKGDFSGAAGLLQFVMNLPLVAKAILRSRVSTALYRERIAGIVMGIYQNVILQKLTASAASTQFAQLVANNPELFKSIT